MFYVRGEGDIKVGIDEIVKFVTDITKIHLYDELLLKVDMIDRVIWRLQNSIYEI